MNIYVGNLSFSVSEDQLKGTFGKFGEVSRVQIITDGFSGRSKGFGFVSMDNQSEAEAAIKGLNQSPVDGRNIVVNEARPKTDRPQGRRPRY